MLDRFKRSFRVNRFERFASGVMAAWLHDLATYRHIHSYESLFLGNSAAAFEGTGLSGRCTVAFLISTTTIGFLDKVRRKSTPGGFEPACERKRYLIVYGSLQR